MDYFEHEAILALRPLTALRLQLLGEAWHVHEEQTFLAGDSDYCWQGCLGAAGWLGYFKDGVRIVALDMFLNFHPAIRHLDPALLQLHALAAMVQRCQEGAFTGVDFAEGDDEVGVGREWQLGVEDVDYQGTLMILPAPHIPLPHLLHDPPEEPSHSLNGSQILSKCLINFGYSLIFEGFGKEMKACY